MQTIAARLKHAFVLLRNLGPRRFAIVLICWLAQRYQRSVQRAGLSGHSRQQAGGISRDPVLVYQMSKVGSTSLLYSLQFAYVKAGLPGTPLYHAHTLTNLDLHERLVKDANREPQHLALVHEYKRIRAALESDPNEHWQVISLVRDPVARQISDFFHHIDRHLPDWQSRWRDGGLSIDEVRDSFLAATDPTIHWFEGETLSVLGIDVYANPFPCARGYDIYSKKPKADLLVMRLEDMDRVASEAVGQFLGFKSFKLHSFNLGSEFGYSEIYQQFKAMPLPDCYLEKVYGGRLARHFYTDEELDRFAAKWSKRQRVMEAR